MKWLMLIFVSILLFCAWQAWGGLMVVDTVKTASEISQSQITQAIGLILQLVFLIIGWFTAKEKK